MALVRSLRWWVAVMLVCVVGAGCAKPEKKKAKTIRVRAPYTSVDVEIPEGHEKDTKVDVDVRP